MRAMASVGLVVVLAGGLPVAAAAQDREPAGDAQQPTIQARPGGPENTPRTSQEVPVTKGTRLVLSNNAGEVVVRSWDRDVVKIEASHGPRDRVDIQTAEQTLRVRSRTERGPGGLVDYQVTVPGWMPVNLSGSYLEAAIEGTSAEVTVETVHGGVRVVGGSGTVAVRSVMGQITVDKASGRVQATSVNEGISLTNVTGDMTAETTNGDIVIDNAQTSNLEISTVNGDITFNGTVRDGGAYRLTTHSGDVSVGMGPTANATVFVRTFQGDFSSDFPIQLPPGQSRDSGSKRFNFTLGSGSARMELQSFNGDIHIARGRVLTPQEQREQRRRTRKPGDRNLAYVPVLPHESHVHVAPVVLPRVPIAPLPPIPAVLQAPAIAPAPIAPSVPPVPPVLPMPSLPPEPPGVQ